MTLEMGSGGGIPVSWGIICKSNYAGCVFTSSVAFSFLSDQGRMDELDQGRMNELGRKDGLDQERMDGFDQGQKGWIRPRENANASLLMGCI